MTGKHAEMTVFSRHLTGKFHVQSLWDLSVTGKDPVMTGKYTQNERENHQEEGQDISCLGYGEKTRVVTTQRDWTYVGDGKNPSCWRVFPS